MTYVEHSNIDALIYLRENKSLPIVSVWAVEFAVYVSIWTTRRNTRAALKQLTGAQLADVGLTREQALSEASRVFWKA
ncbi:MAG: DUF1127 domain-containing protein [Ascidiaceihabitans sp.]|nr:DUF1127 domain-containing protein [Ascidiaceihabitans sp.]